MINTVLFSIMLRIFQGLVGTQRIPLVNKKSIPSGVEGMLNRCWVNSRGVVLTNGPPKRVHRAIYDTKDT